MAKTRHASAKPSAAEAGGFGIPAGAVFEVKEAAWVPASEIGENYVKGDRGPDDPTLRLICEVEGMEDQVQEALSAGKAGRLVASEDGEFLDIPDGSSAAAYATTCNAYVFLHSACDTKKHGRMAMDEDIIDLGISNIVGLKAVAGRLLVSREFQDSSGRSRPTLVCDQVIALPKAQKGGGAAKAGAKSAAKPTAKAKAAPVEAEEDVETETEKAVLKVLENPKYKNGLGVNKIFVPVLNVVKGTDNQEAVTDLVQNRDWVTDEARPWIFDADNDRIQPVD